MPEEPIPELEEARQLEEWRRAQENWAQFPTPPAFGDGVPLFNPTHPDFTFGWRQQEGTAREILNRTVARYRGGTRALPEEAVETTSKPVPYTVKMRFVKARAEGRRDYYLVQLMCGDKAIDEYRYNSEEDAIRYCKELHRDMCIAFTRNAIDRSGKCKDLRGKNLNLPRARQPDRRGVRPREDVVSEDGLVLDLREEPEIVAPPIMSTGTIGYDDTF